MPAPGNGHSESAKVLTIDFSELGQWAEYKWDSDEIDFGQNVDFLRELTNKIKGYKLKRGDILKLEPWQGYVIFNGLELQSLEEPEYGITIPEEFEVLSEFPIHYWDTLGKDVQVPLNISKHFGLISTDDIYMYNGLPYFPIYQNTFEVAGKPHQQLIYIGADASPTDEVSAADFAERLIFEKHFYTQPTDGNFSRAPAADILYVRIL